LAAIETVGAGMKIGSIGAGNVGGILARL